MKCFFNALTFVSVAAVMMCNDVTAGLSRLSPSGRNSHDEPPLVSDDVDYDDELPLRTRRLIGQPQQIIQSNNEPISSRSTTIDSASQSDVPNCADKVGTEIDESLIINFLKTYKHINAATLLMCDDDDHFSDGTAFEHRTPASTSQPIANTFTGPKTHCSNPEAGQRQRRRHRSSSFKFLVRVPKLMMAKSILIKACDIDGVMFGNNSNGPEVRHTEWAGDGVPCSPVQSEGGRRRMRRRSNSSETLRRCQYDNTVRTNARLNIAQAEATQKLMNVLKSGLFHHGVVLDLSCRRSGWVLEQVRM